MSQKSGLSEYHALRKKIKDVYAFLQQSNITAPQTCEEYMKGTKDRLRYNLSFLTKMYNENKLPDDRIDDRQDKIKNLYEQFIEYGEPLPHELDYYTKGTIKELDQTVTELLEKLADIDSIRQHRKLVKEIGVAVQTLKNLGDMEAFDNIEKYVGKDEDDLTNEVLRHNLDKLNAKIKDYNKMKDDNALRDEIKKYYNILIEMNITPKQTLEYYLSGNRGLISDNKFLNENLNEIKQYIQIGKPDVKTEKPAPKPAPKPEAKKSTGKDDTYILNELTKLSDTDFDKIKYDDESKRQLVKSLFNPKTESDMKLYIGRLNNAIRTLTGRPIRGAPVKPDTETQPIIISKQKEFDNAVALIDSLMQKNDVDEASRLATETMNIVTIAMLKGEILPDEYNKIKDKLSKLVVKDKNIKSKKIGKSFHHDFLNKNIKKVTL